MTNLSLGATSRRVAIWPGLDLLRPGRPLSPNVPSPHLPGGRSLQLLRAVDPATVNNVERLRVLPLAAGVSGLSFVLLNRFFSGVSLLSMGGT